MLTEFGGIAFSPDPSRTWGYSRARSADDFERLYTELMELIHKLPVLSGFCYTQFCDTYQEANGLLTTDRQPKFELERMAKATRGSHPLHQTIEWDWRERIMEVQRGQYLVPPEDYHTAGDR
jgi:hypothetical protein